MRQVTSRYLSEIYTTTPSAVWRAQFGSLVGPVSTRDGPDANYLEFKWADYLRAHWAQTSIEVSDIDAHFDGQKIQAALQLAAQNEADHATQALLGKASCQSIVVWLSSGVFGSVAAVKARDCPFD